MKEKLTPFNPVDCLQNEEEIIAYLQEALEDEDPNVFIVALGHIIKSDAGIEAVAKKAGISRTSLYKTISGSTKPKWGTVHKLLHSLNLSLKIDVA